MQSSSCAARIVILDGTETMKISLRGVLPEDSALLFRWYNDPETRRNSIDPAEISSEEHSHWFERMLSLHPERIAIAEIGGVSVGVVRFDWDEEDDGCEISFTVAPEHRGKGIGFSMVQHALTDLKDATVLAKVKFSNIASRRIFERLGFTVINSQGELLLYAKDMSELYRD